MLVFWWVGAIKKTLLCLICVGFKIKPVTPDRTETELATPNRNVRIAMAKPTVVAPKVLESAATVGRIYLQSEVPEFDIMTIFYMCVVDVGCGQTSSENNTYFAVTGPTAGTSCSAKVCPCSDNICQVGEVIFYLTTA